MDEIWKRNEVDSPCVKLCVMHEKAGICVGCFRTIDEIANWSTLSPEARKALLSELPDRQISLRPKRRNRTRKRQADAP